MIKRKSNGTKFPANLIGPQIRRLRVARGFSQSKFVERLQLSGLDIRRDVLGQMESQLHCVKDNDIAVIARVLDVRESDLFLGVKNGAKKLL